MLNIKKFRLIRAFVPVDIFCCISPKITILKSTYKILSSILLLPLQTSPSPENPSKQVQVKLPPVLLQFELTGPVA